MDDDTLTILLVVLGVGVVAWLLVNRKRPDAGPLPDVDGPIADGDNIYAKGAKLVFTALTDPNAIQHALGLPGSDGWGSGIFEADYGNLPDDVKLYRTLSIAAWQAQDADTSQAVKQQGWAVAKTIMPEIADGKCCDFDRGVPLARGHGTMTYLGDYRVSFNQNGTQRFGTMRRLDPPHYDTNPDDWGFKWIDRVSGTIVRDPNTTESAFTRISNKLSQWVKL